MANTTLKFTKDNKPYYEIRVRNGRGNPTATKRWYVPDGWGKRAIDRELIKVSAEFERQVKNGDVHTRKEQKALDILAEEQAAQIKTFKQYAEAIYLPSLEITASRHTIDDFKRNLKLHIYPAIGDKKIPDVTTADLTALLLKVQSSGLKVASAVKVYCVLNLVFKKAYLEDVIEKNPMEKVSRPKAKKEEGKETTVESYSPEELKQIMKALQSEPLQWQCYINLLIDSGCRRGEACGLRWCDVDFKENCITFEHSLAYTTADGIYLDSPKNGKSRKVYIDPAVMDQLKLLKQSRTVVSLNNDGYVFTQADDSFLPMHPDSPTRYFKKFGDRYGIKGFHPHKLRHSFASIAITNGADPVSVSQKLGHSDVAITLRVYSHASAESQKRASDIFRAALNEEKKEKEKVQ